MKNITVCILVTTLFAGIGCQQNSPTIELQAPLFENMGSHELPISTHSELAQRFFNQGMVLLYGFNLEEAARSFEQAYVLDSTCAMAYWGHAYILGPNYNGAMEEDVVEQAYQLSQKAHKIAQQGNVEPWEAAMIEALTARYPQPAGVDRAAADAAYADAMREVQQQFPEEVEIKVLLAEAIMDLHPWDLWKKNGDPQPWTPEILTHLRAALEKNPNHPQANHMYIHATEASQQPNLAETHAQRLETLVPNSGHLVHMPSHTYIRTGDYHSGTIVNQKAVVVDSLYIAACNAQGVYPLAYYPHNIHFLAACAALEGRGELAIEAARLIAANTDKELMREPAMATLQHFYSIPMYVMVKFAQWEQILDVPLPDEDLPYLQGIWNYARGRAYVGQNELPAAKECLAQLQEIARDSALAEVTIWDINSVDHLIAIAAHVLSAEILTAERNFEEAISHLNQAIQIEDNLNYNEPPDWFFSVRHLLGNVLISAGKYQQAEQVYQEDLANFPENGWALSGLYLSLMEQEKESEAMAVKERLDKAWQYADTQLDASRVSRISEVTYEYTLKDLYAMNDTAFVGVISRICGGQN